MPDKKPMVSMVSVDYLFDLKSYTSLQSIQLPLCGLSCYKICPYAD